MAKHRTTPPRVPLPQAVAACTAFAAFAVSVAAGALSGNPTETVLSRALVAMAAAFAGGFLVGLVCEWIVSQRLREMERADALRESANVDADGLTGVDILEEPADPFASRAVETENRRSLSRVGEKNPA